MSGFSGNIWFTVQRAWVVPALVVLIGGLSRCSASSGSVANVNAAGGPSAGGVGGESLIVGIAGTLALNVGGTSSDGGAAGGIAVVPPWTPPPPDDNCGAHCFYAPELPQGPKSDPGASFAGTPSGSAPVLVYPLAGSVYPLNMLSVTFQWQRPGRSHTVARIDVKGADTWTFYVACQHVRKFVQDAHLDECVYELPHGSWGALAYANKGSDVTLTVTTSDGAGSVSSPSAPITISFSDDAVQGALYYWSVKDTGGGYESGIMRAPFGAQHAESFIQPKTPANPAACGGCHALSRNGEVIAFSAGPDSNSGGLTVEPTDNPAVPYIKPSTTPTGVLMTLNPDGSKVLAATGDGVLDLWDTKSGTHVLEVDPSLLGGQGATHPEWSPDGTQIAVTLVPPGSFNQEADLSWDTWSVKQGGIGILPYNDGKFGPVQVVVPVKADEISDFPSFSPDGQWLAFVSGAPGGPYDDNTQNPNNRLRLVNIASGKTYELAHATQASMPHALPGGRATWPKFAPFTQAQGQLLFLTFHSHLDYGFFTATGAFGGNDEIPWSPVQLWFAAVDLRKLDGSDPSAAPIYLTLQDPERDNHLGFWTEKIGCAPETDAGQNLCGSYAECVGNVCVPSPEVPK